MKSVAIVICNYNKVHMVLECIQGVLDNDFTDYDLYVVDNASTDGAPEAIRERFGDRLTLLVNEENLGGSGGFNTGLRAAYAKGYRYYMCVDNDAIPDTAAIGELYRFLEAHAEVGMAASKVYHLERPDTIQQYGQTIDFDYFCTEVPYFNYVEDGSLPEYLYVDSAAACSLMVRREVIDRIGFLPEDNFLYWDDTEWCYLCNRAGWRVASVGSSKALHAMGAKKESINTFPTYYAWRNWLAFFIKYTPEEKLERMAKTFLSSIFQEVYADLHKGEREVSETIMLAYEDAMHGVNGKAGDNRIFRIHRNRKPYEALFAQWDRFWIDEGEFPTLAGQVRKLAKELKADVCWEEHPGPGIVTIVLCENIFRIDDLTGAKVYIDLDLCILRTEDDMLDVINFNYSERTFLYAQLPVFLENIRRLRGIRETDQEEVYGT